MMPKPRFKVWRKTALSIKPICEMTTGSAAKAVSKQLELRKIFLKQMIYITGDCANYKSKTSSNSL